MQLNVRYSALFWKTLEVHRNEPYYGNLRTKMAEFIERKKVSTMPVSGRDVLFTSSNKYLAGIRHYAIQRNPDIVLFYTLDGGELCMAMVGNHHDYPHGGKNKSTSVRTGTRISNAVNSPHVASPQWDMITWNSPEELLGNPEITELSSACMMRLRAELDEEMQTGERFRNRFGIYPDNAGEDEFYAYMGSLEQASAVLMH